ncbi:unnamed protein product [Coffea canephora]|uniref:DH200=94 genomic scaffold, scaffold_1702 n=1 Tax=Coffea canephora TaxID=49390 RepID=A0A068VM56_COFCA|nr:unnamed protein product [Coffea canephora]
MIFVLSLWYFRSWNCAEKCIKRLLPQLSFFGTSLCPLHLKSTKPWDYYTNYPVTLPLRRPYSGDPEHLDQEEFGDASERKLEL